MSASTVAERIGRDRNPIEERPNSPTRTPPGTAPSSSVEGSRVHKREVLAQGSIFSELEAETLDKVVEVVRTVRHSEGQTVFRRGDPGGQLFCIVSGSVKVESECDDGRRVLVNILRSGEVFGEMALLCAGQRSATVTTLEPSEFLVVGRREFLELLDSQPRLSYQLLVSLSERLRRLTALVEKLNQFA